MNMVLLERAKQQWEFAADSMPQFICLLDRDSRVIRANRTVERWKLGIDIEHAGGLDLHELLHRDCDDASCYLRRFRERTAVALAKGRLANCDAWDPILKRHFLIRARRPTLTQQRKHSSLCEVFAVVTVNDVTEFKAIEKESEELSRALKRNVMREEGKRMQAKQVHSGIIDALEHTVSFFALADAGGALCYLNSAGRALLRLESQEEVLGVHLSQCHAPGVREQLLQTAMPAAARDGSWSGESALLARDGREIRTALEISAQHGEDGQLAGYCVQERDMTGWVRTDEALRTSASAVRRLAAQQLAMQETERRRIAAVLHDGLGQSLSLLKLGIREALSQMGTGAPQKALESVQQLLPKVAGALDELRRVSMDLRPSTLDDLGILPTLSWFVREIEGANPGIRIEKHISTSEKDVPEPLKLVIYRILQEAVNNALRHSGAGCIKISLYREGELLAFSVEDDGKGFDPGALESQGDASRGFGLQHMRDRAELSGGTYALNSAAGEGTRICVLWPAPKAEDAKRDRTGCALSGPQSGATTDAAGLQAR